MRAGATAGRRSGRRPVTDAYDSRSFPSMPNPSGDKQPGAIVRDGPATPIWFGALAFQEGASGCARGPNGSGFTSGSTQVRRAAGENRSAFDQ